MQEELRRRLIQILIAVSLLGLLGGLAAVILTYHRDSQARSAQLESLSEQARDYENELLRLRREAETQELHIYTPEGPGAAVFAFRLDSEETLQRAVSYGENYRFTPAILLDLTDDTDSVLTLLEESGLEIIFYSADFSENDLQKLRDIRRIIKATGCVDTQSFLLRSADDTEENRAALSQAGIQTLFLYDDLLDTSVLTDGTTKLNYSYVSKSGYSPANRLANLANSEQALLFAIDLKETTVTEHQMDEIIELICQEEENGHIRIGSVADAVQTVQDRVKREENRLNEYMAAQDERAARIAELEATIREIYSQWDK